MADLSQLFQQFKINPISQTMPQKRPMTQLTPAQSQARFSPIQMPMMPPPQQAPAPGGPGTPQPGANPMMQYIQQYAPPASQPQFNLPGVPQQPVAPQTPLTLSSDQLNQIMQQVQAQQAAQNNPGGFSFAAAQGGLMGPSGVNPGPNFAEGGLYGLPQMAQGSYGYGGYAKGGLDSVPLGSENHMRPRPFPTSGRGAPGLARGPGNGTSDSIRAPKLSNGEFVHTAKAVQGAGRLATGRNNTQAGARAMYGLMRGLESIASH